MRPVWPPNARSLIENARWEPREQLGATARLWGSERGVRLPEVAAAFGGATPAPAVNLVNLETPSPSEPETGNLAPLHQTVNRRLVAVEILGEVLDRYDFPGHFLVQHESHPV
jgi:hypothetical protein